MINRIVNSAAKVISEIHDRSSLMIEGFGEAGSSIEFIHILISPGAKKFIKASYNNDNSHVEIAALTENKQIKKTISSFPEPVMSKFLPEIHRSCSVKLTPRSAFEYLHYKQYRNLISRKTGLNFF